MVRVILRREGEEGKGAGGLPEAGSENTELPMMGSLQSSFFDAGHCFHLPGASPETRMCPL